MKASRFTVSGQYLNNIQNRRRKAPSAPPPSRTTPVIPPLRRRSNVGTDFKKCLEKHNRVWNSSKPSNIAIQKAIAEVLAPYLEAEADPEYYEQYSSMDNVLGIILGGGVGSRLYPLTKNRSKPAVPLAGNYRLIDIPVSNCINSDITKMYCLTQFNSLSLTRHLNQAYDTNIGSFLTKGFVEVLAAQQSPSNESWFRGTADAVRQYHWIFEETGCDEYIILSGDHLYRMDYRPLIYHHRLTEADITVCATYVEEDRASSFGLMKVDSRGRIIKFAEKPVDEELLEMKNTTGSSKPPYLASMGVYVFNSRVAKRLLMDEMPRANDFGSEIIPEAQSSGYNITSYIFEGYWEDIGTIESFYNANLKCNSKLPDFNFYDAVSPIYSKRRHLPPTRMVDCSVTSSSVCDGSTIIKSKIENSTIGVRSYIGDNCVINDSIIMGADHFEQPEECEDLPGCIPIGIGAECIIKKAIIDKNARIGSGCHIVNANNIKNLDAEDVGYMIKDGIIIIPKNTTLEPGTII
tara:strand:- start:383 stop:1942 length:1560 start_codon:yes stop_codon:yes gene_type:complete